jgi:hypothetical protein
LYEQVIFSGANIFGARAAPYNLFDERKREITPSKSEL